MIELLPVSIGIGLVVSLLFSELFGLVAGGMVVPGYVALHLTRPLDLLMTFGAAVATFAVVHALSSLMIIYGRRRTVLMILVGYLLGFSMHSFVDVLLILPGVDYAIIGYIIPGLIATWIDRQGLVESLAAMVTAAVVVRLALILFFGAELRA
jgi:poly-gamma-glutamate biosynthesis protein PgsC/CapC